MVRSVSDADVLGLFDPLWENDREPDSFTDLQPLLAHYTSIPNLESIVSSDELWFSNPLLMNDFEELRFGVLEGARLFRNHAGLRAACGTPERYEIVTAQFEQQLAQFSEEHAVDTYIFCFSEHQKSDSDGLLSMWRGYGGNGSGVAIVVDSSKIEPIDDSPMTLAKVHYASRDARLRWIDDKLGGFASILRDGHVPNDKLYIAVYRLLDRLKQFSLFSKHIGFDEEREWRAVYRPEDDSKFRLQEMLGYAVGHRGITPKLKFPIRYLPGVTGENLALSGLVDRIILGPSVSSALQVSAVKRMLQRAGKPELAERVVASETPFRSDSA